MALIYFEGPAGTGKTTSLMNRLIQELKETPLNDGQSILALTFMHGSRRRLEAKMKAISAFGRNFICSTIDSFAWRVCKRWIDLGRKTGIEPGDGEDDYEKTCEACAHLLENPQVGSWVSAAHPFIVVDEAQDCVNVRVRMLRALASHATLLAAADHFQDLNCIEGEPAITWLKENGQRIELVTNHRTNAVGLLLAARAIRTGNMPVSDYKLGFTISHGYSNKVALASAAKGLIWNGCNDAAILCPGNIGNCAFFKFIVDGLMKEAVHVKWGKGKKEKRANYGPFRIKYEESRDEMFENLITAIGLKNDTTKVRPQDLVFTEYKRGVAEIRDWIRAEVTLKGRTELTGDEIRVQSNRIIQRVRAYTAPSDSGIRAMTIHQAKNREFDNVIILWPYQIIPDTEKQKRLLYNGVTRAKNRCWVIVQGNSIERRLERMFENANA